jgi:cell fate regulator YaaT (PSP1 superfamily)
MPEAITRAERNDLMALARRREKVAKTQVEARSAELLADFERQMASVYTFDDDETWQKAMDDATKALQEADETIKERCKELGIPMEYRPGVGINWHGRGQNEVIRRQAELRRVAKSRIKELAESAKHRIEAASVDVQEQLMVTGLNQAAREALAGMPTPEQLMPVLDVIELENAVSQPRLGRGGF